MNRHGATRPVTPGSGALEPRVPGPGVLQRRDATAGAVLGAALAACVLLSAPASAGPVDPGVGELNRQGVEFYEARKYYQAIDRFKRALELDPDNPEIVANLASSWSGLGVELLNSGESAAARRAFEDSIALHEGFYAHFGLGYIHFLDHHDSDARDHLSAALALREDFAKAHKFLAMIEYRAGREKPAIEAMQRAVALDAEDAEAVAILARWRTEARITRDFRTRRTDRFEVRHDPAIPAAKVDRLIDHLEASIEAIGDRLGYRPRKRLVVGLFGERSFHEATGAHHWIGGLYDGQIKIAVSDSDSDRAEPDRAELHRAELHRAIQHELTHALVKGLFAACPNWLNEGIAQYFEYAPVHGGGVARATATAHATAEAAGGEEAALLERRRLERRREVVEKLRQGASRRVPFARIPARLWEVSDEDEARWTYLQGLGFVEHLASRYRVFRLRLLLETAREEGSLARAFRLTYGKTLEELEEEWWRAISG